MTRHNSYHGCFTGDCPHSTQLECMEAINEHCGGLEHDVANMETMLRKIARDPKAYNGAEIFGALTRWGYPANPLRARVEVGHDAED